MMQNPLKRILGGAPQAVPPPPQPGGTPQVPPWFPTPRTEQLGAGLPDLDIAKIERVSARMFSRYTSYQASAAPLAYVFMGFEQVPQGKLWEVIRVNVVQADPFTAPTGTAILYVATEQPQDSATEPSSFPDLITAAVALPITPAITRRQVVLQEKERVIMCYKTIPANLQITGSLLVIEYDRLSFLQQLGP